MTEQLEIVLSNVKANKRQPKSLRVQSLDRVITREHRIVQEAKYRMYKLKKKDGEELGQY
jgi:hypothetical protein